MSNYEFEKMQAANAMNAIERGDRNRNAIPQLKAQRYELAARIERIDALLTLFEKNPDFVKMYDLARELI